MSVAENLISQGFNALLFRPQPDANLIPAMEAAIIGRWLASNTQIFVVAGPTRGIDVGAKAEKHDRIERLAREGRAVIVVLSELPEVIRVSERVLVMRRGRIAATLGPDEISKATITRHAIPAV